MISKECFVYLQLPRSGNTVTAGKLLWEKSDTLAIGRFVYGKNYLSNPEAIPLDPVRLPLGEQEFENTINEGIFGPIRDASPDRWGRYVIEKNTPTSEWDEMGYLLNSSEDRVGALSFGVGKVPPAPVRRFNQTIDLDQLIVAAQKIEQDILIDETERALLLAGSSMGGARPKVVVEKNDALWLAKFPSHADRRNYSRIELAMMRLARECGLRVPDVDCIQIGGKDVFLIKRFDRLFDEKAGQYVRTHFVSGLTLLGVDESDRSRWSYLDLADEMRRWITRPAEDLKELFQRIIFNCLVSNTDDHPRNHGFLLDSSGTGYRLSPAYDIVPQPSLSYSRHLAMSFGDEGRVARLDNLISRCEHFGVKRDDAKAIYERIRTRLLRWRSDFERAGVSESDLKYLEPAFHWESVEGSGS